MRRAVSLTFVCAVLLGIAFDAAHGQAVVTRLATAPDQTLTADGVTLRYREAGTGEPVLLIHGYSAALESQSALADALAPTHRVVALDVRGFGKSSKFADADRFGPLMVDDIVRLLDHLKIARAHVVGHSMGAVIAANVASRYPARVASATLIAGPFYGDKATFAKETAPWVADLQGGKGLTNFVRWLFPAMAPAGAAGFNAQILKTNDLPALIAVMRSLPELAMNGLGAAGAPSLVVVGTGDPLHPLSKQFAQASPGARLVEIDGADHITVVNDPEFLRAVRDLLQRSAIDGRTVHAGELRVMTSGAFTAPYLELTPQFERTMNAKVVTVTTTIGTGTESIPSRIQRGEPVDVVILPDAALDELIRAGKVVAGSKLPLARSAIGMAVRTGAARPDISTVDGLKRALLVAQSIAYSASVSGDYLVNELFPRLGIAEQVKSKSRRIEGERVGAVVARGDAEIGFQQISELLPISGIDYVGPLPADVQRITTISAAVAAHSANQAIALALVRYLASPAAASAVTNSGLEPVSVVRRERAVRANENDWHQRGSKPYKRNARRLVTHRSLAENACAFSVSKPCQSFFTSRLAVLSAKTLAHLH